MQKSSQQTTYFEPVQMPWYKYITVEPTMFLYMMAFMITNVVEDTFYVFRACTVNHGYSEEICYNISQNNDINKEVQKTTAMFYQWNSIASHMVPLALAFFLGSYSDKRGRKLVLLSGLVGKLYFSIMIIINTLNNWPVEYVIYTAAFPCALTGADLAIFASCFAYIADVSKMENRTFRVGILDVVYLSTMPIGIAIGKVLYNKVFDRSFTIMFTINASVMFLALVYSWVCLDWQSRPEQRSLCEAGVRNPLSDFFDVNHIKHTIITLTKRRSSHRRSFLWMLLFSMALYTLQREEKSTLFLYTSAVFQWDMSQYSNYRTYASSAYVIVMLLGIPFITKVLRWRDTMIVMVGAASHMSGHFIYAQAREGSTMYMGATVAALGPMVAPLIRSMTSKVLQSSERGVAYAFLSVMENAVAMFAAVVYSQLYNATLHTDYPNAIFYFTMSSQAVVFLFALITEILLRGRSLEAVIEQDERQISETTQEQ